MDLHSKFATKDIGFKNTHYCFVRKNFDFLKVKEIESVSISFAYCSGLAILSWSKMSFAVDYKNIVFWNPWTDKLVYDVHLSFFFHVRGYFSLCNLNHFILWCVNSKIISAKGSMSKNLFIRILGNLKKNLGTVTQNTSGFLIH